MRFHPGLKHLSMPVNGWKIIEGRIRKPGGILEPLEKWFVMIGWNGKLEELECWNFVAASLDGEECEGRSLDRKINFTDTILIG